MSPINNFYKKINSELVLLTIIFLFFFQLISDFVEAVYMLELLKLAMDEKALAMAFFLSPFVLLIFKNKIPNYFLEIVAVIIVFTRVINPLIDTAYKIICAGFGVGAFMLFFPVYFSESFKEDGEKVSLRLGVALALAVLLSITFRALNSTIDISTYNYFQFIGWILAGIAILSIIGRLKTKSNGEFTYPTSEQKNVSTGELKLEERKGSKMIYPLVLGLTSALIINYFAFSSPTVISRWTGGNYIAITIVVAVMISLSILVLTMKPEIIKKLKPWMLWLWNIFFIISVVLTIAVHTFPFPANPDSAPVIIDHPAPWFYYIPLGVMIISLPIVFIDVICLSREVIEQRASPSKLGKAFGLGGLFILLMSLILIFTYVWGYVDPVSPIFRNLFWLPFLLVVITIPTKGIFRKNSLKFTALFSSRNEKLVIGGFLAILLLGTTISVSLYEPYRKYPEGGTITSLKILTYNVQQGVNMSGEKNYDKQLALIKEVSPDIIGLIECDVARLSGGNTDIVRYFVNRLTGLNYFSFYGPKTVTGTYGAAVLSKYPIIRGKTIFTYSDEDEIGTTEVKIKVDGIIFNVYINHPSGSDDVKLAHMETLMDRIEGKDYVISMGDFNTREGSLYYNMSVAVLQDVWLTKWPTGIDNNGVGVDKLREVFDQDRIDHIFVSNNFNITMARYILDPQSDHPALWAVIEW